MSRQHECTSVYVCECVCMSLCTNRAYYHVSSLPFSPLPQERSSPLQALQITLLPWRRKAGTPCCALASGPIGRTHTCRTYRTAMARSGYVCLKVNSVLWSSSFLFFIISLVLTLLTSSSLLSDLQTACLLLGGHLLYCPQDCIPPLLLLILIISSFLLFYDPPISPFSSDL